MNAVIGDYKDLEDLAVPLPESMLNDLEKEEFTKVEEIVTLKGAYTPSKEGRKDPTGIECRVNRWHFDEVVADKPPSMQEITRLAISFAMALRRKVDNARIPGKYRIIISSNSSNADIGPSGSVRFHQIRDWNPWMKEDIESYRREAVMVIDWETGAI